MWSALPQDFIYAWRRVRRQPGFALVIVLTLGSAMGVNTSFFSMFNAGALKPWPVRDPDAVVAIHPQVSLAEWRHWTDHARSFVGLTASLGGGSARSEGQRLYFELVSARFFDVLEPVPRGRGFLADEDRPGGAGTDAVISHRLWETRFASDPNVLGRSIALDGVAFTIVGIASEGFDGTGRGRRDLWLPLTAAPRLEPDDLSPDERELRRQVSVAGRLAARTSAGEAQAELATLSRRFRAERSLRPVTIVATDTRPFSYASASERALNALFFTALTFATLIACANVANLLLARGYARRGEIGVRLALGAGRPRVVRQLLVEAFVLALFGSLLGLAIAHVLPEYVFRTVPDFARRMPANFRLDYNVFLYAFALSTLSTLVFGLAPALHCTRISVSHALKDAHGLSVPSLKTALPGYQVIVSVMLLAASGLLVRSVQSVLTAELGYSVDGTTFVGLEFPSTATRAQRASATAQLLDELQHLAGAENVAAASIGPSPGRMPGREIYFDLVGRSSRRAETAATLDVTPRYFDVLGIPLVSGRFLAASDEPGRVAVVNETFARRFSPGESPIGKTIVYSRVAREIVGVARDVHLGSLETVEPVVFQPAAPASLRVLMIRDSREELVAVTRAMVARIAPELYVEVLGGPAWLERITTTSLFGARLVGGIGVLTLALATLGLFSVSAYVVQQRTREIGIRMALGARHRHIVAAVLAPSSVAMLRGFVIGGAGAIALAFLMRHWNWLNGVSPLDPIAHAGVVALLVVAGVTASYLPARRAMKVEPTVALRYE